MSNKWDAYREKAYKIHELLVKCEKDLLKAIEVGLEYNEKAILYYIGNSLENFFDSLKNANVYVWPFFSHENEAMCRWDGFIRRLEKLQDILLEETDFEKRKPLIGQLTAEIKKTIPAIQVSLADVS